MNIIAGRQIEPTPTLPPKYNALGGFSFQTFSGLSIPEALVPSLIGAANHSLAANSHRSYKTAVNHIGRVEEAMGVQLTFPFSLTSTLTYIGYLLTERKVSAATIDKYMSGLRMAHMQRGVFSPWIKPDIVKTILTGQANKDQLEKRLSGKKGRLPMTPDLMKTLKSSLVRASMPRSQKRTVWLCATWCWAGAFRIHEILARTQGEFDPSTTLLHEDISGTEVVVKGEKYRVLRIAIKHPKEERLSDGIIMDLFESKGAGKWMCPVKAWDDWNRDIGFVPSTGKPAIRQEGGLAYTGSLFNGDLKKLLVDSVDYSKGSITSHSFRAGLATWMSKAGYSDQEIMAIGRWHSAAFLRYVKTPREQRAVLAAELTNRVNSAIRLT